MKKLLIVTTGLFAAFYLIGSSGGVVVRDIQQAAISKISTMQPQQGDSGSANNSNSDTAVNDANNVDTQSPAKLNLNKINRYSGTKISSRTKVLEQQQYRAATVPNDPYAGQAWEAQIGLATARDEPLGNYTPKVAVIDGGFALEHEDLESNWLVNDAEFGATTNESSSILNCTDQSLPLDLSCNVVDDDFNGVIDDESGVTTIENQSLLNCTDQSLPLDKSCNLIDDDANGVVDDYKGFDFVNYERSVVAGEVNPTGDGVRHGSSVAGIVGATNNNSLGLAGVAGDVEVLPIQVLDDYGYGYTISVADGIIYAVSRGVDVINLSLGSGGQDLYIEQAIDYATEQGVVVVAAAGNDGCDCDFYPAAYKPVVSVGATNESQQLAAFSNFGAELDIVAPGVNLISTSWSDSNQVDLYEYVSGTSASTPVVSGIVSRLVSYKPDASPIEIKALLHETTDKSMLAQAQNRNDNYGYGFIAADTVTQRTVTPLINTQLVAFDLVRSGSGITDEYSRQEVAASSVVYRCQADQKPATTVYKLSKNSKLAYTVSEQEVEAAKRAGFSSTALFGACILQSHDSPQILRNINTARELDNFNIKKVYY